MTATAAGLCLRPSRPGDEPFLRTLFRATRAPEFAALELAEDVLQRLLAMQYVAQDRSYRALHPGAAFDVVQLDDVPIGRLSVDRTGDAIRVLDIALMPEHRGRGIGTELLQRLIAEGRRSGRSVTLSIVRTNPALALYRRLGFEETGGDDVYLVLTRQPAPLS